MIFTAVPEVDGHIEKAEKNIDVVQESLPEPIMWNLCPGSMGIWPDPIYVDRHSRKHAGMEFAKMYLTQQSTRHAFLFVRGSHEDHYWLRRRRESGHGFELVPGITWLVDGYKTVLHENLRVTGLGGVYSPVYYDEREGFKTKLRAYRRSQVEKACSSGPTDILLIHEHPSAEGIASIVFATRPQLIIYASKEGGGHTANPFNDLGVLCYGVSKGGLPLAFNWKEGKINPI